MPNFIQRIAISTLPRSFYKGGLFVVTCLLSFAALILPIALRPAAYPLNIGEVSSQDIVAPNSFSYTSEILTQKAQQEAANSVGLVYLPADPGITRTQIDNLQIAMNFITSVRSDQFASQEQKILDLSSIKSIQLSQDTSLAILGLSDSDWNSVQQEALTVLEQTMRKTIHDYQVQDARNSVPSLVSFSMPEDQSDIVVALVTPFVIANSLYSPELTTKAQNAAISSVQPVVKNYASGQTIIQRGQVITPEQFEALQKFGLIKTNDKSKDYLSAASLVFSLGLFVLFYFRSRRTISNHDLRNLTVIAIMFLIFLYGARFLIPNRAVIPYFYPIPAFALIIAALVSFETGFIFTFILSILASYQLTYSLNIAIFYIIASAFGLLVLGKGKKISQFLLSALSISFAGMLIILAFRFADPTTDIIGIVTLVGVAILNGFASASIALLGQFLLSQTMGLTTALSLIEISRPDYPLQQFILQNAPGTYQHSLMVANLAEQAAEAIGADPILTRAGALYHDSGKSLNPQFFIENQVPGKLDAHDEMDPVLTAQTIIAHVTDGSKLAAKYRLPPRIRDFINEHHGTMITAYQYGRALQNAGKDASKVDIELFRYPGPAPRSKETAILMFADRCEARARAELPKDDEALRILIRKVLDECIAEGQLDQTNLSFRDIKLIETTFLKTLQNTYHPRIKYPEVQPSASSSDKKPATGLKSQEKS